MPKFEDMPQAEKDELIRKIGDCLKANDLGTVPVTTYREMVCPLADTKVEGRLALTVDKELPSTEAAKVDKFKEAIKPIIEGVEGVEIKVVSKLAAGDMYKTITGIQKMGSEKTCDLPHTEGEVWLLDFWATWCPPCQAPMAHN